MCISISNNGLTIEYKHLDNIDICRLKKELTLTPVRTFGKFKITPLSVYIEEKKNLITIPIYYYDENKRNKAEIKFSEITPMTSKMEDRVKLRESQIECYNIACKERENEYGGGIINLSTGSGKTVVAIKLISYYKMKTLILVSMENLLTQWYTRLREYLGPDVSIGVIQGNRFEIECDIVIGMIQTISVKKSITSELLGCFDLCFIDEVHLISTAVFSRVLFLARVRYTFGLTATLERQDKLEKIILWHLGKVLYSNIKKDVKQNTNVYFIKYSGESSKEEFTYDGTQNISKMLTNMAEDKERTDLLIKIIIEKYKNTEDNDSSSKILVLSDRNKILIDIYESIKDEIECGLLIGGIKQEQREATLNSRIILGNYKVAGTGLDCQELNTLISVTPRSNIAQIIGRIYRKKHIITPSIIDIVDDFSVFKNQYYKRKTYYKNNISNVKFIEINKEECVGNFLKNNKNNENNKVKCLI
jgi:superfamily II DNA or RNA helicase